MIIKSSLDPNIKWVMSEGNVPYEPNEGSKVQNILYYAKKTKLYRFIEGVTQPYHSLRRRICLSRCWKRLHSSEAELIVNVKDKRLHQVYKGLSAGVVKEAFDWNDNYTRSVNSDNFWSTVWKSSFITKAVMLIQKDLAAKPTWE